MAAVSWCSRCVASAQTFLGEKTQSQSPLNVTAHGSHKLKFRSVDDVGNTEAVHTHTFTITS